MSSKFDPPPNEAPNLPLKRRRLKRIEDHSNGELNDAIQVAVAHCKDRGFDFFKILHGIDAYMERRKRIDQAIVDKIKARSDALFSNAIDDQVDVWGDS